MRRVVAEQRPFFTVIWFGSPHGPYSGTPADVALYSGVAKEELRHRFAEITAMDRAIGQFRATLRELGVAGNTLVWFNSDNGLPPEPDFHGGGENFRSVSYMAIPSAPMQTLSMLILDGVLDAERVAAAGLAVLMTLVLFLSAAIHVVFRFNVLYPIQRLIAASQKLGRGQYAPVEVSSADEVGLLARDVAGGVHDHEVAPAQQGERRQRHRHFEETSHHGGDLGSIVQLRNRTICPIPRNARGF